MKIDLGDEAENYQDRFDALTTSHIILSHDNMKAKRASYNCKGGIVQVE